MKNTVTVTPAATSPPSPVNVVQTDCSALSAEPTTHHRSVWAKTIALTALAAIALQVCVVVYGTLSSFAGQITHTPFVPWTFHTLWEIAFLALAAFTAVSLGSQAGNFFSAIFLGGLLSGIAWLLVPDSLVILRPQYYAIESRITTDTHEAGRNGDSAYDFPLSKGSLYHKDDRGLKSTYAGRAENNEYVGARGFLFWQTGLANGYDPLLLNDYNGGKRFLSRVELFFTVGPLVIVEATLTGLTRHFPIFMLVVALFYAKRKESLWFA